VILKNLYIEAIMTVYNRPETPKNSYTDHSIGALLSDARAEKYDQKVPNQNNVSFAIRRLERIIKDVEANKTEPDGQSIWDLAYVLGEIKILLTRFENKSPQSVQGAGASDKAKIYYAYNNIFEPFKLWQNSTNDVLDTMFSGSIDNFEYQLKNKEKLVEKLINNAKSTIKDFKAHVRI
jgi:hypothetical protein